MKKLFILFAIMLAALTSWAQNWEPRDTEIFTKNYESLVLTLSQEEQEQLTSAQNAIKTELNTISDIKLYANDEWFDYSSVTKIAKVLQNIKSVYEENSNLHELLGAWMAVQYVQTKDIQMGFLDNFLMIIAGECADSNKQLKFDLAMLSYKIQMNYNSVLNR